MNNKNGHHYPGMDGEFEEEVEYEESEEEDFEDEESLDLTDEIDHAILMHREAHFGGDFTVMIDYYNAEESVGINPDFEPERILYLSDVEKELGQDLAALILTGAEAEAVGRARQAYAHFKELYALEENEPSHARLIADLILSEEEEPLQEIEAIVEEGPRIVPDLLALLSSDEMYDPIFPGYGYAPYLAILCLGKIGDPRGIIPIFETLSKQVTFDEMVIVEALAEMGEPAKEFLLKILKSRPMTQDNPNAAFALIAFSQDPRVAIASFEQLKDPIVQDKPLLRTYLLCNCEALNETSYKADFITLSESEEIPADLGKEMRAIIQEWDSL